MREIKFRAWHKIYLEMSDDFGLGDEWIMFWENAKRGADPTDDDCEIMQFTGLKDKNGKEIYEGDILKVDNRRIVEIYWFDAGGCFDTRYLSDNIKEPFRTLYNNEWDDRTEIIGNIYENPELLND